MTHFNLNTTVYVILCAKKKRSIFGKNNSKRKWLKNPFWVADIRWSTSREMSRLLWKQEVYYRVHHSPDTSRYN
jgi:hypothetical protein